MKKWILLFLAPIYVYSADLPYQPTILSLNHEFPIEISIKNRENISKSQQDVEEIINSKRFHWEYVVGFFLLALLFLISRHQPEKVVDKDEILRKQRLISKNKALSSLKGLSEENLPREKRFDEFYNRITYIVREYIEKSYSINAPKKTTEEFLRNIQDHPVFNKNTESSLAEFLKSADAVKFSEHTPTLQDCAKAQKTAEDFVSS